MKKADPNSISVLHENISPNFFWGPPGLRKWHYLEKFPTEKVVTHLKKLLWVIQHFWHCRNAWYKKKSNTCLRHSVPDQVPIISKIQLVPRRQRLTLKSCSTIIKMPASKIDKFSDGWTKCNVDRYSFAADHCNCIFWIYNVWRESLPQRQGSSRE